MEATNTAWKLDESGTWTASITAASNGGGKIIYDPWDREIPNRLLQPKWVDGDIVGWTVTIAVDGMVANLYLTNEYE